MTKSVTSLAVGIASDQGLLALNQPIKEFFQEEWPETTHPHLEKIQVQHLLTMTSGIHDNTYGDLYPRPDWIRAFLQQEFPHEPGSYYRYSTHGSHMLSAIIRKTSGLSLEEFLNRFLFYPMEIYEAQWEHAPEGLTAGGMGLSLYPRSLAKIAQLLLCEGRFGGKQLISGEYLRKALSPQIIKQDETDGDNPFSGSQYGYQFHIGKNGYPRADGAFGQLCLLCPDRNLAFIVFSRQTKTEALLSLIYTRLLDGTHDGAAWKCMNHMPPAVLPAPVERLVWLHAVYQLKENPLAVTSIHFDCESTPAIKMCFADGRAHTMQFSCGHEARGEMYFVKDLQEHLQKYVCRVVKAQPHLLELYIYYIETPYVCRYTFEWRTDADAFFHQRQFYPARFYGRGYFVPASPHAECFPLIEA